MKAEDLDEKERSWATHRTASFATDLLAASLHGRASTVAREAADFLVSQDRSVSPLAERLAKDFLRGADDIPGLNVAVADLDVLTVRLQIHDLRSRLGDYPRDSLRWSELARLYAISGLQLQAKGAMSRALSITPHNRFLLRSAARLSINLEDPDYGHYFLRVSPATPHDPWLLSAEIALSSYMGKHSPWLKHSRTIVESQRLSPFHLTELASAVGTVEAASHREKRARRLLKTALVQPTENSVAQVEWLARNTGILTFDEEFLDLPSAFEARARSYAAEGEWADALINARAWLFDQPFDVEPAIFGSYEASISEDYENGLQFASVGLRANPSDFALLNNATFCLIHLGELETARARYGQIRRDALADDSERATYYATGGLLGFREGRPEEGRKLYEQALEITSDAQLHGVASALMLREEVLAGRADTGAVMRMLQELASENAPREVQLWIRQIQKFLDHLPALLPDRRS